MATDSARKTSPPDAAEESAPLPPVPLELFPAPPPARRRSTSDPTLRPLVLSIAAAYQRKYGVPLAINWGREMKNTKRTLALLVDVARTLTTDPTALLADAYDCFLAAADFNYQRVRHDTRLFWRDITRFTGEAADRRRGIQALPAHQRPVYPQPSHHPRWMNDGQPE